MLIFFAAEKNHKFLLFILSKWFLCFCFYFSFILIIFFRSSLRLDALILWCPCTPRHSDVVNPYLVASVLFVILDSLHSGRLPIYYPHYTSLISRRNFFTPPTRVEETIKRNISIGWWMEPILNWKFCTHSL